MTANVKNIKIACEVSHRDELLKCARRRFGYNFMSLRGWDHLIGGKIAQLYPFVHVIQRMEKLWCYYWTIFLLLRL